ncbi:hypothetical protein AN901_204958 [Pseudomonas syringae pv. theae]|nr:hypothetical protein AN901_204958 [Pseudomonas syringae pv. theae]
MLKLLQARLLTIQQVIEQRSEPRANRWIGQTVTLGKIGNFKTTALTFQRMSQGTLFDRHPQGIQLQRRAQFRKILAVRDDQARLRKRMPGAERRTVGAQRQGENNRPLPGHATLDQGLIRAVADQLQPVRTKFRQVAFKATGRHLIVPNLPAAEVATVLVDVAGLKTPQVRQWCRLLRSRVYRHIIVIHRPCP